MISIITPVLNGSKYIRKNIESIMKLRIPYEHIIVDGGSTDDTLSIINEYKESVVLIKQSTKNGMYGGINDGFSIARGEYITWINCDDYIITSKYEDFYLYAKSRDADFITSDGFFSYEKKGILECIPGSNFTKFFLNNGIMSFSQPSSIYKKDLYDKVNGFNLIFRIAGDIDLFYRISIQEKIKFMYYPAITTVFLKHGESLGDLNTEKSSTELKLAQIPTASIFIRIVFKIERLFNKKKTLYFHRKN